MISNDTQSQSDHSRFRSFTDCFYCIVVEEIKIFFNLSIIIIYQGTYHISLKVPPIFYEILIFVKNTFLYTRHSCVRSTFIREALFFDYTKFVH